MPLSASPGPAIAGASARSSTSPARWTTSRPAHGESGHAEQDPEQVLAAALEVLRDAAAAARRGGAEVSGIAISVAMHALVGSTTTVARSRA